MSGNKRIGSTVVVGIDGGEHDDDVRAAARLIADPAAHLLEVRVGGRPAATLRAAAVQNGAELIAVGESLRSALDRLVGGDPTPAMAYKAQCSVLVAPGGFADGPPRLQRIGVAYDGRPESEFALGQARRLAERSGAKIFVRNAVKVPEYADGAWDAIGEADRQLGERVRRTLGDHLAVEVSVGFGPPRLELAAFSDGVDLLICGARHLGALERALRRTVSDYLAQHCTCPVLIVPRVERPALVG